jgi:anti-sigma factor RsiW
MEHPPEPIMIRYLHSLASKKELELVEEHLNDCSECCQRVAEFARSLVYAGSTKGQDAR